MYRKSNYEVTAAEDYLLMSGPFRCLLGENVRDYKNLVYINFFS